MSDDARVEFSQSVYCRQQGSWCRLCRNQEQGRSWRQARSRLHVLPNDQVDFVCPLGKPWIDPSAPPPAPELPRPQAVPAGYDPALHAQEGGCNC